MPYVYGTPRVNDHAGRIAAARSALTEVKTALYLV